MAAGANRLIVRRYIEAVWDTNHPAAIDGFLAPQYRRYLTSTSTPLTRDGQKQRLAAFRTAFPDMQLTIDDMLAEGDRVALRSTLRGTHRGVFLSIPPTGRAVTVSLIDVMRIEQGQIIEHWGGPDLFDLVQQLGARLSAGPAQRPTMGESDPPCLSGMDNLAAGSSMLVPSTGTSLSRGLVDAGHMGGQRAARTGRCWRLIPARASHR